MRGRARKISKKIQKIVPFRRGSYLPGPWYIHVTALDSTVITTLCVHYSYCALESLLCREQWTSERIDGRVYYQWPSSFAPRHGSAATRRSRTTFQTRVVANAFNAAFNRIKRKKVFRKVGRVFVVCKCAIRKHLDVCCRTRNTIVDKRRCW